MQQLSLLHIIVSFQKLLGFTDVEFQDPLYLLFHVVYKKSILMRFKTVAFCSLSQVCKLQEPEHFMNTLRL